MRERVFVVEPVLDLIAEEFGKAGIPYLVVGGCAINLHGYSRRTDDVDVLIRERDADAATLCLKRHGYAGNRHGNLFSRLIPDSPLLVVVDLMFVDDRTFDKMHESSVRVNEGRHEHRIPTTEHLLAMKLHALRYGRETRRSKDAQDIVELARAAGMDLRSETFRELCLKFGDEAVLRYLLNLTAPFT
jgi:hypothetical protein